MPYASNEALPERIRRTLPPHGQDIYRAAFNQAFVSYSSNPRREEIVHRVAWAAVKKRYMKSQERWVERET
ncbi:MAG: ChaB family protein [Alphaproteobacteria bacterium]|nr:ChaB family protein [Alphaproteobacteria bacterium]